MGNGRAGYSDPRVETQEVKTAILNHGEFKSYRQRVAAIFDAWREAHEPLLKGIEPNANPKNIILALSENLLARFSDLPLLSRYNVFQRLMDYWDETMQDDVYLITANGWVEAAKPRGVVADKGKKIKETPDLTVKRKKYKMDLIPPTLIVARYFAAEQTNIDKLQAVQETVTRKLEEFVEEHTGEDGLLLDTANDKGKVTRIGVKTRLKAIRDEPETDEERDALIRCLVLIEAQSKLGKAVKQAQAALDRQVLARYAMLTEAQIKVLVVEDKWFAGLRDAIEGEVQQLTQRLAGRVKELEARYARPLPELEREVEAFGAKVEGHLKRMGLSQQLLTGKTRLPGFSGKWETKRLGDMGRCLRGVSYDPTTDLSSYDKDSTVRLLRSNNIQNAVVIATDVHYVESRRVSESQVMQPNDILLCMANGSKELVGKAGLFRIKDGYAYTFGSFMGCFRIELTIADPSFVFYLFQTREFRDFIGLILAGSSINNLKPSNIESAEFQVPGRNEQTAIAAVLSDMDAEIAALEQRRDKVRAVQQGMMQQLLTGRVRLVKPE